MRVNYRIKAHTGWSFLAVVATMLTACSGGGGSDEAASAAAAPPLGSCADCGTLLVAVTDADGDFVSYSVDVVSVTLRRPNGASLEVLPSRTRIDFAQLTDLADLLSVATVAPGDFVGGTIRLDYGGAEVFVEAGGQIVPARVVGADGAELGVVDLSIDLSNREHLVIARGRNALLSLDFDLLASHEVDITQAPAVVAARPYIVAEVVPVAEKELRVRGALVRVDAAQSTYTLDVRPWHRRDGNHGRVTVHTTATTSFEVAGATYSGAAGLAALAQQPAGALTVAFGTLAVQSREFTASIVHAGDSVSGERIDAVHGNVVARRGNELIVKGAFAVRRDRAARFHRTVIVELAPGTKVSKIGTSQALAIDAISVGQSIVAFGTLEEPATAGDTAPPTLDATTGRVRLLVTHLHGTVNGVVGSQLNMRLRAIDRLAIEMFDFTGTGITAATDADPDDYEVATGALTLGALQPAEAVKALGFARAFGSAPADFDGRTVIDRRDLPAALGIGWSPSGTTAPFLSIGAAGLVLDLGNSSGERHFIKIGSRVVDLLELPAAPTIVAANGRAVFGLWQREHVELFTSFDDFVAALALRLSGGEAAVALAAYGSYDETAATLHANRIAVYLAAD
jgi:hypothetical protein